MEYPVDSEEEIPKKEKIQEPRFGNLIRNSRMFAKSEKVSIAAKTPNKLMMMTTNVEEHAILE